jgi:arylsulfatase
MVRWPGKIKAGSISTQMFSGLDWFPTLLAAAGDTTVKDRLLKGWQPQGNAQTFKNHLDGFNQLDYLTGKTDKSSRTEYYYFSDDGDLVAMRYGDWKLVFMEQRMGGGFGVWNNPFTALRIPKMYNLRMDPYERADLVSDQYYDWLVKNDYIITGGMLQATAFLETFVAYPPSQHPPSFNIDQVRKSVDQKIEEAMKKAREGR